MDDRDCDGGFAGVKFIGPEEYVFKEYFLSKYMGLKLKNFKETILLIAFVYTIFSMVIALFEFTIKDGESLSWALMPVYYLFYAAILITFILFFAHSYSIKRKELYYFPKARFLLIISLTFLIISILIQSYNPLIMAIAKSNSDFRVCNNMLEVNSPLNYLEGPRFFLWMFYKEKCISDIALNLKDVSICDNIMSLSIFDETTKVMSTSGCIRNLAIREKNISLCNKISSVATDDSTAKLNRDLLQIGCLRNFNKSISYTS